MQKFARRIKETGQAQRNAQDTSVPGTSIDTEYPVLPSPARH